MKKSIAPLDYAGVICNAMNPGILLTTKSGDTVNTMTIGWGTIGVEWGKPIFIGFVRESRYTRTLLKENAEFTINVPYGDFDKNILGFCGRTSGKNIDKIAQLGLTLEEPEIISVPGIRELPLTLECKVVYAQAQELSLLCEPFLSRYYPQDVDGSHPGSNRDYHIAFYGEIVDAYIIQ